MEKTTRYQSVFIVGAIAVLLFAFTVLIANPTPAEAAETGTYKGFQYQISKGKAIITDYIGNKKSISIPAKIKGKPVTYVTIFRGDSGDLDPGTTKFIHTHRLKSINLKKAKYLKGLDCTYNYLTKIDASKNKKLVYLDCTANKVKKINVSKNTKLKRLDCSANKLKKLDVSKNKKLVELNCSGNRLKKLNVSKNKKLKRLYCHQNKIKHLDLSKNRKLRVRNSEYFSCDKGVKLTYIR
ncbi:MAG: leucine-rich repeat domain-containing protein [Eggerthellaceae bacterium]